MGADPGGPFFTYRAPKKSQFFLPSDKLQYPVPYPWLPCPGAFSNADLAFKGIPYPGYSKNSNKGGLFSKNSVSYSWERRQQLVYLVYSLLWWELPDAAIFFLPTILQM